MSETRTGLRYAASHEWARLDDDGIVTVGISDYAQESLGDIVFVELPEVDADVQAGDEVAVVESVKAAADIYAPVSGVVVACNESLEDAPERVNEAPYDGGWFFKVRPDDAGELDGLLDAEAYQARCEAEEPDDDEDD